MQTTKKRERQNIVYITGYKNIIIIHSLSNLNNLIIVIITIKKNRDPRANGDSAK